MFKQFRNECIIRFKIVTVSPLLIRTGEHGNEFDPSLPDIQCIKSQKDGENVPIIPGSSLKGVFRSCAENWLRPMFAGEPEEPCDIFSKPKENKCTKGVNVKSDNGTVRYQKACAACRLFGNRVLKSRIDFRDCYADHYKLGARVNVGINRVTGASVGSALYNAQVVEQGEFKGEVVLRNFFPWQLKLWIEVMNEINEGYLSIGSSGSRGMGRVELKELEFHLKTLSMEKSFFEPTVLTLDQVKEKLETVNMKEEVKAVKLNEFKAL